MAARQAWRELIPSLNIKKLVFLDETSATTNMTRRYGRSLRGERLVSHAPHGHWQTTTFIAGLRYDSLTASAVFDGPMDGSCFTAYVTDVLVPTLKSGDIVVLDNLSCHKVAGIKKLIEQVGAALLYLPAYSPDFNPIEQLFAKLKSLLRKAATRTREELWNCIANLLAVFSVSECTNYFGNSGYLCQD